MADLPAEVQSLCAFRTAETEEAQALVVGDFPTSVRWDLLADAAKGPIVWKAITARLLPFSTVFEPLACKNDHGTTSIFRPMKKPRPRSDRGEASRSSCGSLPKPWIATATNFISPQTAFGSSTPCRYPT